MGWGDGDWRWKLFFIISKSNDGTVNSSSSLVVKDGKSWEKRHEHGSRELPEDGKEP